MHALQFTLRSWLPVHGCVDAQRCMRMPVHTCVQGDQHACQCMHVCRVMIDVHANACRSARPLCCPLSSMTGGQRAGSSVALRRVHREGWNGRRMVVQVPLRTCAFCVRLFSGAWIMHSLAQLLCVEQIQHQIMVHASACVWFREQSKTRGRNGCACRFTHIRVCLACMDVFWCLDHAFTGTLFLFVVVEIMRVRLCCQHQVCVWSRPNRDASGKSDRSVNWHDVKKKDAHVLKVIATMCMQSQDRNDCLS